MLLSSFSCGPKRHAGCYAVLVTPAVLVADADTPTTAGKGGPAWRRVSQILMNALLLWHDVPPVQLLLFMNKVQLRRMQDEAAKGMRDRCLAALPRRPPPQLNQPL